MRHMKRLLVVFLLTIGATVPVTATGVLSAHADLGDPYNGCWQSGAITVRTASNGNTSINLLYSPMCGTAWATFSGCDVDAIYVHNSAGDVGNIIAGGCAGYTAMVDDWSATAQAVAHSRDSGWYWTTWF
jgi:hypothetical protein